VLWHGTAEGVTGERRWRRRFAPTNKGFSGASDYGRMRVMRCIRPIVYVGVVNDKQVGAGFLEQTGGLSWVATEQWMDGNDVGFSLAQAPDGTMAGGDGAMGSIG